MVFPHIPLDYWVAVGLLEMGVVAVEALFLWLARVTKPLQWALLANAASAGLGFLINLFT